MNKNLKKLKNTFKRKNMFIRTFILLSVATIIPLIIVNVIFSNQSKTTIKKMAINNSLNLVDKTSKAVDIVVKGVNQTAIQLSQNENIINYIINPVIEDYSRNNAIINELNNIVSTDENIHSIYIYSHEEKSIISSSGGVYSKDKFYDTEWIQDYETNFLGIKQLATRRIKDSMGNEFNCITYICNLPYLSLSKIGAVVININEDKIYEIIKNIDFIKEQSTNIFILDKDNNFISHKNKDLLHNNINNSKLINSIIKENESYTIQDIDGEETMFVFNTSEYNGWKYIYTIPTDYLFKDSEKISGIIYMITFLFTLGLLLLYYIISKGLYKPVKKLLNAIPDSATNKIRNNENIVLDEYEILGYVYNDVIHKNKSLEEILESTKPALKEKLIINLLRGTFNKSDEINERKNYLGIQFGDENFVVIVMQIDNYEQFSGRFSEKERNLFKIELISLIESALSDEFYCICAEIEVDKFACIVNSQDKTSLNNEKLIQGMEKVKNLMKEKYPFTVTFALGRVYENIRNIRSSFVEAKKALKYKLFKGNDEIIEYTYIEESSEELYFYKSEKEKALINNIKTGQRDEVFNLLNIIFEEIMENPKTTKIYVHQFFMRILDSIISTIIEINIGVESVFGENYNLYKELSEKETILDIRTWMYHICDLVVENVNKVNMTKSEFNIKKVIEYIVENYNKDISLNDVAEYSNLSSGYVCKIFKDHIGKNYTYYLNDIRIEKAKELLKETKLTVKEVGFRVGFNNIQTFMRTFKKHEGITPGQFRLKVL
jgi:YesN/AraC family two-component response regulator